MFSVRSIVLLVLSYVVIPRLTFLPKNVHSVLIVFGPFLLPKLIELFNTARATSRSVPVRPTPPKVQNALNLLFVSAVVCLALSFANFAPENIFVKTSSHIRTETSVLFARLRHLRPLTPEDEALREKFMTRPSTKLQYLAWGPDTLLNCAWCVTSEGSEAHNYFLYSLPKVATPHIAHLAVLGLATSSLVGSEGSRFRTHATIAGLVLLVIEGWFFATYDVTTNKKARTVKDLDSVHWRLRFLRLMAFTITDIVLAAVLWATSTNRWLAKPISIAERLEMTTRGAEESLHRLRALGLLTNSVNRDPTLREMREMYWRIEGQITAETVQEEEVMEEINKVINKIDLRSLEGRAGEVADTILQNMDGMPATAQMKEGGQLS